MRACPGCRFVERTSPGFRLHVAKLFETKIEIMAITSRRFPPARCYVRGKRLRPYRNDSRAHRALDLPLHTGGCRNRSVRGMRDCSGSRCGSMGPTTATHSCLDDAPRTLRNHCFFLEALMTATRSPDASVDHRRRDSGEGQSEEETHAPSSPSDCSRRFHARITKSRGGERKSRRFFALTRMSE